MVKRARVYEDVSDDHGTSATKYVHCQTVLRRPSVIECGVPPHRSPVSFATYEEYEAHYTNFHVNRCSECSKNFPSERFVLLHIAENHDPILEAKRARGDKTFACFVEGCKKMFLTRLKRRNHLVDAHHYHRQYDFFVVNDGLHGRKSMLRSDFNPQDRVLGADIESRKSTGFVINDSSSTSTEADLVDETILTHVVTYDGTAEELRKVRGSSENVDDVAVSMAALRFIPPSIRFDKASGGLARKT